MTEEYLEPLDDRVRLVELVDRVLDKGVVLRGDVIIGVAGIDLIYLELRLLLSGVQALQERGRRVPLEAGYPQPDDDESATGPAHQPPLREPPATPQP